MKVSKAAAHREYLGKNTREKLVLDETSMTSSCSTGRFTIDQFKWICFSFPKITHSNLPEEGLKLCLLFRHLLLSPLQTSVYFIGIFWTDQHQLVHHCEAKHEPWTQRVWSHDVGMRYLSRDREAQAERNHFWRLQKSWVGGWCSPSRRTNC